jgi:hypothetical protein
MPLVARDSLPQTGGLNTIRGPGISDAVVQLLHDYIGRGRTRSRTTINEDIVLQPKPAY